MEGVVLVVVVDAELQRDADALGCSGRSRGYDAAAAVCGCGSHQPPLERDGVDVEVFDQTQVVVHVLQAAQHLQRQRQASALTQPLDAATGRWFKGSKWSRVLWFDCESGSSRTD